MTRAFIRRSFLPERAIVLKGARKTLGFSGNRRTIIPLGKSELREKSKVYRIDIQLII